MKYHNFIIQKFFRVLYFSIHRYDHGEFWPNLRESEFDSIGSGPGVSYNINVPLNRTGMTDGDYLAAFHQILLKVAYQVSYLDSILIDYCFKCYEHLLW